MPNLLNLKSIIIAAVVAFLAGLAAGSWGAYRLDQARVLKAEGKAAELTAAYAKRDQDARDAVLAKEAADRKTADAIAAASAADARVRQVQFNQMIKENKNVEERFIASGQPVHFMPIGWVRQYDSGFAAANREAGNDTSQPQTAAGRADTAASDVSEWEVLDNHAINAAKWADCRRQVNDLLDILNATD